MIPTRIFETAALPPFLIRGGALAMSVFGNIAHNASAPEQDTSDEPEQPTIGTLGRLLIASWAYHFGPTNLPDPSTIADAFRENERDMPDVLTGMLHLNPHPTGLDLEELSPMIQTAQRDGLVKRYNPSYTKAIVRIGRDNAEVLRQKLTDKREIISWIDKVVTYAGQKVNSQSQSNGALNECEYPSEAQG